MTLHATLLAAVVWLVVAADVIAPGPWGRYSRFPKGNDFVQFYVAGTLVRTGAFSALVDDRRFRAAQSAYLPPDSHVSFPPVYGPVIGLLFAPLSHLPYLAAYAVWSVISLLLIAVSLRVFWQHCPPLRPWPSTVVAVAAAFPPLGYLILDGQLSALAVAALALLVVGLARQSSVLSGLAVGLLGYKLSLLVPAIAVCVLAGERLIPAVAILVTAVEVVGIVPLMGTDVLRGFLANAIDAIRAPDALAVRPYLMASLRTFWTPLLPELAARCAYAVTALSALGAAAVGWRAVRDPLRRVSFLAIAIALASPHLFMYDLLVLAPAFVASTGLVLTRRPAALRRCLYVVFLAPLAAPLAALTHVQFVTLALVAWLGILVVLERPPAPAGETT